MFMMHPIVLRLLEGTNGYVYLVHTFCSHYPDNCDDQRVVMTGTFSFVEICIFFTSAISLIVMPIKILIVSTGKPHIIFL